MTTANITSIETKDLPSGDKVLKVTLDNGDKAEMYASKGVVPAGVSVGASIDYNIQEVVKGKYTNLYLRLLDANGNEARSSGGGAKKAPSYRGNDSEFTKPMDPATQARVTRLSCLASASAFLAGDPNQAVDDVIEVAKRFYEFANAGE